MRDRRTVLEDLIRFDADANVLADELGAVPWDSERELIELRREDVVAILKRFLSSELDGGAVERWADLIEGRDDIGLDPMHADQLKAGNYELANPTILEELR